MKLPAHTVLVLLISAGASFTNEFAGELQSLAGGQLTEIAAPAEIISSVKAKYTETADYDQGKISKNNRFWSVRSGECRTNQPESCRAF